MDKNERKLDNNELEKVSGAGCGCGIGGSGVKTEPDASYGCECNFGGSGSMMIASGMTVTCNCIMSGNGCFEGYEYCPCTILGQGR